LILKIFLSISTLQLSGYTSEIAKEMAEISAKADDSQFATLAMMGLAQQINFNSFSLRFDDQSITNKALDYAAEMLPAGRSDVISMASAMVQFSLANLQHADFSAKVSQAVGTYLNEPRSIEVVAAPSQPLPFMSLFAASQDPKSLIDMLNVEVNANK